MLNNNNNNENKCYLNIELECYTTEVMICYVGSGSIYVQCQLDKSNVKMLFKMWFRSNGRNSPADGAQTSEAELHRPAARTRRHYGQKPVQEAETEQVERQEQRRAR